MTVLFKSTPGSRRWQHTVGCGCAEDCGYTVILGSNRNRCLKIERDGQTCAQARSWTSAFPCLSVACLSLQCLPVSSRVPTQTYCREQVDGVPGANLSPLDFTRFWICFSKHGAFAVGAGAPGAGDCFCWADPAPLAAIKHIGLSTWDKHTAYRDIQLHPPAPLRPAPASLVRKHARAIPKTAQHALT